MAIILPANTLSASGYDVANSCRFNDDDGANMNKAYGGSTDTNFTFSAWVKRSDLGNTEALFSHWNGSSDANRFIIYFEGDSLVAYHNNSAGSASDMYVKTSAVYRDPSAWYHFVVAVDTTQGTASNRVKIYTNGVLQTALSQTTYPAEDYAVYAFDTSGTTYLGRNASSNSAPTKYFDGYMAEVCLIDGTTYAASDFGEFDEDSPTIWKPKDVSTLTFGANGTYLDFEDSDNLGDDESGNTNDLTETNIAAADQATDTPTNNFCVWNALDNFHQQYTFSQGNCQMVTNSGDYGYSCANFGLTSGKWFWEVEYDAKSSGSDYAFVGFVDTLPINATTHLTGSAFAYAYYTGGGWYHNTGSAGSISSGFDTYTVGDVIGVALNLDDNEATFYKNGTAQNSGTAISITAPASTNGGMYFPAVSWWDASTTGTFKANFGGCSAFTVSSANQDGNGYGNFEYAVPSGFYALCTKNLAEYG